MSNKANGTATAPIDRSRRALLGGVTGLGFAAGVHAFADTARAAEPGWKVAPATRAVEEFRIRIPDQDIRDLKRRLTNTRWPETETASDWSQGAKLSNLQALVDYWRSTHDWRRTEGRINAWPQFRTRIDDLGIHFIHARSRHDTALPLLLTHGWPGSIVEFLQTLGPLTDPTAFGGRAEDAFHVIVPSLPGFGFSDKPGAPGWDLGRTARAWGELMSRLGYPRWVAQGGDWGAGVTIELGQQKPAGLVGIHLNFPLVVPPSLPAGMSPDEERAASAYQAWVDDGSGYARIMATRPQSIGYGLADSHAGQAAWIYEKFQAWSDNTGAPESALTPEEMLDNIALYWFTNTAASSGRYYRENASRGFYAGRVELPVGVSVFPREIFRAPRSWVAQAYPNLIHWNELPRGGHFAAFEEPQLFVDELRACFRTLRST